MKRLLSVSCALSLMLGALLAHSPLTADAANPIVQCRFTPDPAPMVYDDTVYMYTGRDADGADNYVMTEWQCFSSTDMQNWTDHGTVLYDSDFSWGKADSAWAAQCIERNGIFYYYVTMEANSGGRAIGVAVSDSPTGPFKDALGKPLCGPNWDYIDPTVFIDDDGQAYLYFGNPSPYYVKLNEDMISYSGQITKIETTADAFGTKSNGDGSMYVEGPWFYKRGNLYYLLYAANGIPENIAYSTSTSPTGPWKYQGVIMPSEGRSFTNHCGVIDYKGHSYFAYHNGALEGGSGFQRSAAVEEFSYNTDGTFPTIKMTSDGPKQLEAVNPFQRVEAETMSWSSGIETEPCSAGGRNVANIENGDYVKISGVDFSTGADTFTASVSSANAGGSIKLHIDSLTGEVIGTAKVSGTDGWQNWTEVSCSVDVSGEHDLYLEFTGDSGFLFNVDWWQFDGAGNTGDTPVTEGVLVNNTFESGTDGWTGRGAASVASSTDTAYQGTHALYVSGRTAAWNGGSKALNYKFKAGETYSFSANVLYNSKSAPVDTFFMKLQYTDANGDTQYASIAEGSAVSGEWLQLANTDYTIPQDATNISVYIETADSKNSFYIDDFTAATAGYAIKGAGQRGVLIRGDLDGNGLVNSMDTALARRGLTKGFTDSYQQLAADADKSGEYEINDLVLIHQFVLRQITEFPDNTPIPDTPPFDYNPALTYSEAPGDYLNPCAQAGQVINESYNGINGTNSLNVYLPYGYDESKQYNIFYLMHGGGENENTIFSSDVKLNNILDHMIMNGQLEPLIVVTPTFNKCEARTFYKEFRQSVIPFVEGKYSTYAKSTSPEDIAASRMHRAYGGFSMGSASTWAVLVNSLDIVAYYMPLSGDNWEAEGGYNKAKSVADAVDASGLQKDEYFIFAATGSEDIAYPNMNPQIEEMKKMDQFIYTSDFSQGNFYYLVAEGKTHWWGYVRHYVYDALPYFFHEG